MAATDVYKGLNGISKTLEDYVESQKPANGKPAKFKIADPITNHNPETKGAIPVFYRISDSIPLLDKILDPATKKEVYIGVVDHTDTTTGIPQFSYHRVKSRFQLGEFFVYPDTDPEMFTYLVLTNRNGSNKYRKADKEPMFYQVNEAQNAAKRSEKRNVKLDASVLLRDMDFEELKNIAASYAVADSFLDDEEVLRDYLFEKVEENPQLFIDKINSPDLDIYITLKRAVDEKIITYNAAENKVLYTDSDTIVSLTRKEGKSWQDGAVDYLSSTAGDVALQNLKSLLGNSNKKPKKETTKEKKEREAKEAEEAKNNQD